MTRDECIDILHSKVIKEMPISREEYAETLNGWDVHSVEIGDGSVGVVMMRDREIHVVIDKSKALKYSRRILRKFLLENIQRYGYLVTRIFKGDAASIFLVRLGFYKTHGDDIFDWYRIDQARIH